MDGLALLAIIVMAGMAAYVQTLTGFAFGLLMMGGVALTGVLALPDAAVLVSVLTLFNALTVLVRGWRDIDRRSFLIVIPSSTVTLFIGYWLLERMAAQSLHWITLALGLVIIASSAQLWFRPHPLPHRSSATSFWGFGAIAGLMGGLFSTPGPPLVYHLYRQPLPHVTVRETLVAIFAANAAVRLLLVGVSGALPPLATWWSLLSIPAVVVMSYAARRWPPPLSPLAIRRIAFVLLCLSGLSLVVPSIGALLA